MEVSGISVVVLEAPRAVAIRAQVELAAVLKQQPDALVSFPGGATFGSFFEELEIDVAAGRLDLSQVQATHLDDFVGYGPNDEGGFAYELMHHPSLRRAHEDGRFLPVPASSDPDVLAAHEARLAELGGVKLQFLGIGSNGHIAYSEPGTSLEEGFHKARLAPSTRSELDPRFAGKEVPQEAITAGPANILAAERVVLVATGGAKAKAVQKMMEGDVGSACPASILRRHRDALVLLDSAAAAGLDWPEFAVSSS